MSQSMETNPHFWPRPKQPGFSVPQQLAPEPWEHPSHPHGYYLDHIPQPSKIHPRVRQPRPQPQSQVQPPGSPPGYAHQLPMPLAPPRHHQPDPHSHLVGVPPVHQTQSQAQPMSQPMHPLHKPRPHHVRFEQGPPPPDENLMYPTPSKTKPVTWFGAVFCCILCLFIILGGLLVLVIYFVYQPQTPQFAISNASLNAAYLDLGSILNADLIVLANFSNPNSKVNVEFGYVTIHLYFGQQLIANQYIEPFSAVNTESKLAYVELVSSQVRLPSKVTQQFINQMQRNRIMFEVDGIFHAKSNFGSLLRYSYWLYGKCIIEMTGPPVGVMIASKCRTKH